MQANYTFSQAVLPVGDDATTVDLLLRFRSEAAGVPARRPLNLSLVIDRSASMAGSPLRHALQAAVSLVDELNEEDILSVVIYDDSVDTVVTPQRVTDKAAIQEAIRKIKPGGCTNLSGGWLKGCEHVLAQASSERVQRVLLLTDGHANAGITSEDVLIKTARKKADEGVITTTLGFGANFDEDLLIGMAQAAGGNFYFIQSTDDAAGVFSIELQSLKSIAAQNLTVTLSPAAGVEIARVLSGSRQDTSGDTLTLSLGDVYENEDKLLALSLKVPGQAASGPWQALSGAYSYQSLVDGVIEQGKGDLAVAASFGTIEEAAAAPAPMDVIVEISRVRIATAKEAALKLAETGDSAAAAKSLRDVIADLRAKGLHERFEIAEELDQLEFFANRLEGGRLDNASRKEMRDQSFQAQSRSRKDLSLRGLTSSGAAADLPVVSEVGDGVELECFREGGKLRIRVLSDGYAASLNVQFPRDIRDDGVHYVVDRLDISADGTFYRAGGEIKRLLRPGEPDPYASGFRRGSSGSGGTTVKTGKAATGPASAADLEATDSVGDGVLIQCVKDGSKLRARVVSDGFDPNWNMRFPRSVREDGMLYVADEVLTAPDGKSYIACGKIKRFVQQP